MAVSDSLGSYPDRRSELSARLRGVRGRISAACVAAGRRPDEVTLVAVTKTYPASDIRLLTELGVADIGENRDQEAAPKAAECAALGLQITWHFVGQLQTNKCRSVASYASVIHSVDRLRLVSALGKRARAVGRDITCLVQVSIDGDPERGGAYGEQVTLIADAIAGEGGTEARRGDGRSPAGHDSRYGVRQAQGDSRGDAVRSIRTL